uniref:Uncharacterized protein n=1 Tax=Oryza brachyantha TaxID=4533 RepID=J3M4G5_ORYBR
MAWSTMTGPTRSCPTSHPFRSVSEAAVGPPIPPIADSAAGATNSVIVFALCGCRLTEDGDESDGEGGEGRKWKEEGTWMEKVMVVAWIQFRKITWHLIKYVNCSDIFLISHIGSAQEVVGVTSSYPGAKPWLLISRGGSFEFSHGVLNWTCYRFAF